MDGMTLIVKMLNQIVGPMGIACVRGIRKSRCDNEYLQQITAPSSQVEEDIRGGPGGRSR
jgi:hypothetical protein